MFCDNTDNKAPRYTHLRTRMYVVPHENTVLEHDIYQPVGDFAAIDLMDLYVLLLLL